MVLGYSKVIISLKERECDTDAESRKRDIRQSSKKNKLVVCPCFKNNEGGLLFYARPRNSAESTAGRDFQKIR